MGGILRSKTKLAFICPIDHARLEREPDVFRCTTCGSGFPIVKGVPILLNEANSVFRIADYLRDASFVGASNYGGSLDKTSGVRRAYRRFVNSLTESAIYGGSRF